MTTISIDTLSDRELLERTEKAIGIERQTTAELLVLLGELDARRLYLGKGCSSLFAYCTEVLHLSEHAAYHRIEGARTARRFPIILRLVGDGSITLTTVAMLRPHLTTENHEVLLAAASHKSKREVEHQIACLAPKPDAKAMIRLIGRVPDPPMATTMSELAVTSGVLPVEPLLSAATTSASSLAAAPSPAEPRPRIEPLSRDRYLLRVTLTASAHDSLRRAQQLMRHTVPDGDPAIVVAKALSLLVEQLERTKTAAVRRPRGRSASPSSRGSRHIPAAIRREVWARDAGRCAFVGLHGRCTQTGRLEFHHVVPFARGGPTTVENVALSGRAHNSYESELAFGPWRRTRESNVSILAVK